MLKHLLTDYTSYVLSLHEVVLLFVILFLYNHWPCPIHVIYYFIPAIYVLP